MIIFVTTLLVYIPALSAPIHWDDRGYLLESPYVIAWDGLYTIWLEPLKLWQYYPVVFTSFWCEYHLWGFTVWPYHLVNVLVHTANAILLMMVLKKIRIPAAFFIALVFALHPIHIESVATISERKNLLSFFFCMLCFLAYWCFCDTSSRRRLWFYIAAIISYIFAIQSKTVVFVFPIAIGAALFYTCGKAATRKIVALIPILIISIPQCLIVRHIEQTSVGAHGPEFQFSIIERLLIAGRGFWFYLGKLLWPHPLMPIYPRWSINASEAWQYAFPIAAIVGFAVLLLLWRRIGHGPWLLAALFFILLAPALGFISFYPMIFSFVSDHYVYLGSVPAIIGIVLALRFCVMQIKKLAEYQRILAITAALILAIVSCSQAMLWQTYQAIWVYNLSWNQKSHIVLCIVGELMRQEGKLSIAIPLLEKATQTKDHSFLSYYNLGLAKSSLGQYQEAIACFRKSLENSPNYYLSQLQLGLTLQATGQYTQAITEFISITDRDPQDAEAWAGLAYCHWALGKHERAKFAIDKATQIAPKRDVVASVRRMILSQIPVTPPATLPAKN